MSTSSSAAFSVDGDYFASAAADGTFKIWETLQNVVKHEAHLKSHVEQTCTSLIWGARTPIFSSEDEETLEVYNFVVMGTQKGAVLLFDLRTDTLSDLFTNSHTDAVNDLHWDSESDTISSCSSDTSIVLWDVSSGRIKSKWNAEEPLFSICLIDTDNLLTSGTSIMWWNVKEQTIIKKFNGHKSLIFTLLSATVSATSSYFLSVGCGECYINTWNLNSRNSKTAVASFKLTDAVENIDVSKYFAEGKLMLLSAVTKSGSLLFFQHILNGKTRKNLSPQLTLKVVSKSSTDESSQHQIPVLSSKLLYATNNCIIAYGTIENPVFEKVNVLDSPKNVILSRDIPKSSPHKNFNEPSSVKLFNKFNEYIVLNGQENSHQSSPKRRKQKDPDVQFENTQHNSTLQTSQSPSKKVKTKLSPKKNRLLRKETTGEIRSELAESSFICPTDPKVLVSSLLQSMQSANTNFLNMVVSSLCEDDLIKHSVKILPHHSLKKILEDLHRNLSSRENRFSRNSTKWIKEILEAHLSYLTSCQDLGNILHLIKDHIEAKKVSETISKMSTLKGLLNIFRIQGALSKENNTSDSDSEDGMES